MKKIMSFMFVAALTLTGCGGTSTPLTGIFLDSAVSGISYRTATQSGTTDAQGKFKYLAGEQVLFSVGNIELPTAAAASVVTPLTLAKTQRTRDKTVINILVFLQSLDQDGDPGNGISIPDNAASLATANLDFALETTAFRGQAALTSLVSTLGSTLPSQATVLAHFEQTLTTSGIFFDSDIFGAATASLSFNYYRDGTTISHPVSFIYAKDIDGDGIDEIFFAAFETQPNTPANYSNTSVHIFGWEAGVFKELTSKWLPGTSNEVEGVGDVCFGDFNGDGKVDVFLSGYTDMDHPAHPYALINQGETFTKVQLPLQTWQHGVTCVDVNKDGFDDVLVAGYSSFPQYFGSAGGLLEYAGMVGSSGIAAGDFLGDGTVQAVFVDAGNSASNDTKLYGLTINDISKTIGFGLAAILPGPRLDTIFTDPTDYRSSHDIRARAIDFNDDGKLDTVVFSYRYGAPSTTVVHRSEIQFLKNMGAGIFEDVTDAVRVGYDTSGYLGYVPEFRDFNDDGLVDLFVSQPDWLDAGYRSSTLLVQSAEGKFVDTAKSDLRKIIETGGGQAAIARGPSGVFYLIKESAWRGDGITRVSIHPIVF